MTEVVAHGELPSLTEGQAKLLNGLKKASVLSGELPGFKGEYPIADTHPVHDKVSVLKSQQPLSIYLQEDRKYSADEIRVLSEILDPELNALFSKTAKEIYEEVQAPRKAPHFTDRVAVEFEEGKRFVLHLPTNIENITYRLSIDQGNITVRDEAFLIGHSIYRPGYRR